MYIVLMPNIKLPKYILMDLWVVSDRVKVHKLNPFLLHFSISLPT